MLRCSRRSTTIASCQKHTIGTQLLTVRRDKRERAAFAATQENDESDDMDGDGGFELKVDLPSALEGDELKNLME